MKQVFRQIPLYKFLWFCNRLNMEKVVLDCGAGGDCPPLSLFQDYGYTTYGVECDVQQIERANKYAKGKGQELNIIQGDMRQLDFPNESMNFVYSYNSVFHMTKADVLKSINEMKRVLKPNGLLFVNFLTTKDCRCGEGITVGNNEFKQKEGNDYIIHSYFEEQETDKFFNDMKLLYKEERILERIFEGERIKQGYIDYVVKKGI